MRSVVLCNKSRSIGLDRGIAFGDLHNRLSNESELMECAPRCLPISHLLPAP